MKKILRMAAALAAAAWLSIPAGAANYELFGWELNPYVGAGFGRSSSAGGCGPADANNGMESGDSLTLAISYRALECEGTGTGFKVYGGLRIYEYLALEGGYVSLGEYDRVILASGEPAAGVMAENRTNVKVTHDGGWTGSAVGMLPLARIVPRTILPAGEVIALGRVGMHYWNMLAEVPASVDYTQTNAAMDADPASYTGVSFSHPGSDSGLDLYFGAGGEYLLDNGVGLRLEWERYLFNGDWRAADADIISLGAVYRF